MLKTLMGDHAVTSHFKTRSDKFDFIEVKGSAAKFYKRVVRNHEFDVAEFKDPPSVQRAPAGKEIGTMLAAGELDAAIMAAVPTDTNLKPVIPDPEAAGKRWGEKHHAIQLNHLVVVKNTVPQKTADEVYDLLVESKKAAGNPPMLPHGLEANRRNLEVAIDV